MASLVHRPSDREQLMECAGLPKVLKPLDAGIHDGPVALLHESHAPAEPFLIPELKGFSKRVLPGILTTGKGCFVGYDIHGANLFDLFSTWGSHRSGLP